MVLGMWAALQLPAKHSITMYMSIVQPDNDRSRRK